MKIAKLEKTAIKMTIECYREKNRQCDIHGSQLARGGGVLGAG